MKDLAFTIGEGTTALHFALIKIGRDFHISLWGGKGHIGSVALGVGRPSLSDPDEKSATVSTHNLTGHKDEHLTGDLAFDVAKAYQCTVVVSGGFHLDDITHEEIQEVLANAKLGQERILSYLNVQA